MRRQWQDNRIMFSILAYMQSLVECGDIDETDFRDRVRANALEHGHGRFQAPEGWRKELPYLIQKFGWRVFDAVNKES
jgi:hypothetical protein